MRAAEKLDCMLLQAFMNVAFAHVVGFHASMVAHHLGRGC